MIKKIYLIHACIILSASLMGQNSPQTQNSNRTKAKLSPGSVYNNNNTTNTDRNSSSFRLWVDPVGDEMFQKGLDLSSNTPDQTLFLTPVFIDSTVTDGSGSPIFNILLGSVLDPKSSLLQSSQLPIVGANDSYTIDSLEIFGSYVKTSATIDTLYTWLVWGNPSDTNVFEKALTSDVWVAPISGWRDTIVCPKISGADSASGNKVSAAAPSGNKILIKYVLQQADSLSVAGSFKAIFIALPSPVTIPAGNIVSCFYTFVPGATYNSGDCAYSFPGDAVAQNQNGFAGVTWGQWNPQIITVNDYQDQQVDYTSWGMGASYNRYQRHMDFLSNFMTGDLIQAPLIRYSISGSIIIAPDAPTASGVTYNCTSFTAIWDSVPGATHYFLDVSTDYYFGSFLSGYNNLNVGDSLDQVVSGIDINGGYFFRVRAADSNSVSLNSNIIAAEAQTLHSPFIASASNITCTSFVANWTDNLFDVNVATGFYLDVSTDQSFGTFVSGYNNLNVGDTTSYLLVGLDSNTTYYYRVRKESNCGTSANSSYEMTITNACNTTGISILKSNSAMKIYPVPASDKLLVSVNKIEVSSIEIIDALGKVVKRVNTNELTTEINVADLQNGVYFLKLTKASGIYTEKITISK